MMGPVNVVSVAAFAAVPVLPAYSISKAAEDWRTGAAKALERQTAALVAAEPVAA